MFQPGFPALRAICVVIPSTRSKWCQRGSSTTLCNQYETLRANTKFHIPGSFVKGSQRYGAINTRHCNSIPNPTLPSPVAVKGNRISFSGLQFNFNLDTVASRYHIAPFGSCKYACMYVQFPVAWAVFVDRKCNFTALPGSLRPFRLAVAGSRRLGRRLGRAAAQRAAFPP